MQPIRGEWLASTDVALAYELKVLAEEAATKSWQSSPASNMNAGALRVPARSCSLARASSSRALPRGGPSHGSCAVKQTRF